MPRRSKIPLKKHTIDLYLGDYDRISELYASTGIPAATIIRNLIRKHIQEFEKQLQTRKESLNDNY